MNKNYSKPLITAVVLIVLSVAILILNKSYPEFIVLSPGHGVLKLLGIILIVLSLLSLSMFATYWILEIKKRPVVESQMLFRLYNVVAVAVILLVITYCVGKLGTFGTLFSLFGGMLLGWSLQAPISGLAAWFFVTLKRPFRINDRIQFPSLGLVGDVKSIGPMYTVLDQVGGSVASEEAVGRDVLIPNSLLFSNVIINYTAKQETPYILDEIVVSITYDSNWKKAEEILINAAERVTGAIIEITKEKPYIRSDIYDYGVHLRLRYMARVKDRVKIGYELNKIIFEEFQKTKKVDFAIPFIYSSRHGMTFSRETMETKVQEVDNIKEIEIDRIIVNKPEENFDGLDQLMESISNRGLLQPIVVTKKPDSDNYELLIGEHRLLACKRLNWKTVLAIIK